jgi:hypothetical protein
MKAWLFKCENMESRSKAPPTPHLRRLSSCLKLVDLLDAKRYDGNGNTNTIDLNARAQAVVERSRRSAALLFDPPNEDDINWEFIEAV